MLTRDALPIETPCGVDFSKMTRKEATKRFCGDCKKHVHDLSSMTEGEAKTLLASEATEGLCVRYLADAAGQIAFLPDVPTGMLSRARRIAMAAAMLATPVALTACMGAARPRQVSPAGEAAEVIVHRGDTHLMLTNTSGTLSRVENHTLREVAISAFVSGTCEGDESGCFAAESMLRGAGSYDEYLEALRAAGFTVSPR